MKIFVAGGTGAVGRYAVPAMVSAGHQLTVVARTDAKANDVHAMGAAPARVDLFDAGAVRAAVAGHDAVVNLATAIPGSVAAMARPSAWKQNDRIRSEGAANLVDAALAAGAGRFVQESIAFTYPDRGDEWIDEDTPLAPVGITASVLTAEASARRFGEASAVNVGVVLRFGNFYGPGSVHTDAMLAAARHHLGPALGPADHWAAPLHLESAGDAVLAALDAPAGTYNVAEEPVTWRQFADALGRAVGGAPWLRVPGRVAALFGDRGGPLHRSQRVSSRRFRDATGWRPRYASVAEGWPAVVAAEAQGQGRHG
jgi:nucleoside-diphosphate-sugar epimerase